ncbi:cupin-like domain-containing protein [Sphingomonas psychrotolerans]|uniref:Cupin-like domain-containing protein n=1 Tax=Sphingomonas psychrotolerans TaxID=1327635 RepID=A0ABU3N2H4_9SPHN|nr:cupin-like domain-containing protein [Sphingomonas psychrotolerans]MDT8757430.1 cupin-like domain-containing protein [Sphingomonas psychrotolerans]
MSDVFATVPRTQVIEGVAPDAIPYAELLEAQRPAILKSVARDWPLVRRGLESPAAAMAYLEGFDAGRPVVGFTGPPEIGGRFAYDEGVTAFNFAGDRQPLRSFLERIRAHLDDSAPPSFYIGSTDLDTYLPGLRAENDLVLNDPMFVANPPIASIWIGNRTTAAAHYDMSNNLAVCVVGRRRFTLFPPDQVANLYPGPLEPTPGGQALTMVDFRNPDFERYPRFREALAAAEIAELEPGDVLFYPALWWHQVDARDRFNILINYWWNTSPAFMDTPHNTLLHALLSLRDRPDSEKRGWQALFDYYVFGPADRAGAHLPEAARGPLGTLDESKARRLRAQLLSKLNR